MKTGKEILDAYNGQSRGIQYQVSLEEMIDAELKIATKEQRHACVEILNECEKHTGVGFINTISLTEANMKVMNAYID